MHDASRLLDEQTYTRISQQLDRLPFSRRHAVIVLVSALGLMFDVAEAALSNALSAVFSSPSHPVSANQLSLLLASVFIGGTVGAPLLGWLADHYGRRWALSTALLVLAATSLFAAASKDLAWLTGFRILSGLALGAYPPLIVAYLSDILPPARRGGAILLCGAIGFLGAPAVIFLVRWLTPLQPFGVDGWRWALIAGSIGSLATGLTFLLLPESPRWLARMKRHSEAEAIVQRFEQSVRLMADTRAAPSRPPAHGNDNSPPSNAGGSSSLYKDPQHRRRALLLSAMYFLSPWATIGFPLLSGAVLMEKGFRVSDSLLYLGIAMVGPSVGTLAGAFAIDRVERRTTLVLCGALMALLGMAFAISATPGPLMAAGVAFNLIGSIYITALGIYAAELFPTGLRGLASSSAWAVNRAASALVPLALLPLLSSHGAVAMFSVVATALVASIVIVMAFGPRGLAGRAVS